MKLIGVTGGSGSGKSEAGKVFAAFGAYVIDADKAVHEIYKKGFPPHEAIVLRFGEGILDDDGEINRKRLGELVFSDAEKLAELNEIVRVFVNQRILDEINAVRENPGDYKAIVLDAIRLIESGFGDMCDFIVVVTATEGIRLKRIMARDGISGEAAKRRIGSQTPISELIARADFIIENNGDLDEFRKQTEGVWRHVFGD